MTFDRVVSGGVSVPARAASGASRQRSMVVMAIELAALARFLASHRFLAYLITGALGLAAMARLSRENQTRTIARLSAWDKQRQLRDQLAAEARRHKAR